MTMTMTMTVGLKMANRSAGVADHVAAGPTGSV